MQVEYWQTSRGEAPVENFIADQPSKAQAKIAWTIGLLENMGIGLLKTKHMASLRGYRRMLYELKVDIMRSYYRILFVVVLGDRAYLLHAISKKTNKTSKNDITIALDRADTLADRLDSR